MRKAPRAKVAPRRGGVPVPADSILAPSRSIPAEWLKDQPDAGELRDQLDALAEYKRLSAVLRSQADQGRLFGLLYSAWCLDRLGARGYKSLRDSITHLRKAERIHKILSQDPNLMPIDCREWFRGAQAARQQRQILEWLRAGRAAIARRAGRHAGGAPGARMLDLYLRAVCEMLKNSRGRIPWKDLTELFKIILPATFHHMIGHPMQSLRSRVKRARAPRVLLDALLDRQ